jgi:hypothetical protein
MSLSLKKKRSDLEHILKTSMFKNKDGDLFEGFKANHPPMWTYYHEIQKEAAEAGINITVSHLVGGGEVKMFNIAVGTDISAEQIAKLKHIAQKHYKRYDDLHAIHALPARPHDDPRWRDMHHPSLRAHSRPETER